MQKCLKRGCHSECFEIALTPLFKGPLSAVNNCIKYSDSAQLGGCYTNWTVLRYNRSDLSACCAHAGGTDHKRWLGISEKYSHPVSTERTVEWESVMSSHQYIYIFILFVVVFFCPKTKILRITWGGWDTACVDVFLHSMDKLTQSAHKAFYCYFKSLPFLSPFFPLKNQNQNIHQNSKSEYNWRLQ